MLLYIMLLYTVSRRRIKMASYTKPKYIPAKVIFNFNEQLFWQFFINPLNAALNPICHLLALLGAHHIIHVSRIKVNSTVYIFRVIKSRRMRLAGHVERMGERRGVYRLLAGKPEGKRQLWRPRRRWEDNIKMNIQKVGCGSMDWIELTQDRDR